MEQALKRPVWITVLAILNWVGAGMALMGFVIMAVMANPINSVMNSVQKMDSVWKKDIIKSDTLTDSTGHLITIEKREHFPKQLDRMFSETMEMNRIIFGRMQIFGLLGILSCLLLLLGSIYIFLLRTPGLYVYILGVISMIGGYFYSFYPILHGHFMFGPLYWFYGILIGFFSISMVLLFIWQFRKLKLI